MMLVIDSVPPLSLPVLDAGPQRAAINGEVPSLSVTIDNARGEAAGLLAVPPLRARATLSSGAEVLFVGTVQAVELDAVATLTVEA